MMSKNNQFLLQVVIIGGEVEDVDRVHHQEVEDVIEITNPMVMEEAEGKDMTHLEKEVEAAGIEANILMVTDEVVTVITIKNKAVVVGEEAAISIKNVVEVDPTINSVEVEVEEEEAEILGHHPHLKNPQIQSHWKLKVNCMSHHPQPEGKKELKYRSTVTTFQWNLNIKSRITTTLLSTRKFQRTYRCKQLRHFEQSIFHTVIHRLTAKICLVDILCSMKMKKKTEWRSRNLMVEPLH